jgi:mannose-1-phosphate guanylyltransferase
MKSPSGTRGAGAASLVLAAGLGTRLRPLTDHVPKPLVPLGDTTPLALAVDAVRRAGAGHVVVNAHWHAAELARACDALGVDCSVEEVLLGTAGGLTKARALLGDGDVLVWNADVYAPGARAEELFARRRGSATLLVRELRGGAKGAGNVGWDEDGRVVRLRRETSRDRETHVGEFLGIHVAGADLARVANGCLVGDVYLPALAAGAEMYVVCTESAAHDIGTLSSYREANLAWLASRGLPSFLGEGARVFAEVARSVVGADAEISAPVVDSVVWPGTRVTEPLTRAIATPFGVFVAD